MATLLVLFAYACGERLVKPAPAAKDPRDAARVPLASFAQAPVASSVASAGSGRAGRPDAFMEYGPAREIRHQGGYTWYPVQLSEAQARAATGQRQLAIRLPDGTVMTLRHVRSIQHDEGIWTWIGRSASGTDETILTFGSHSVFGNLPQQGRPSLRIMTQDSRTWLVETEAGVHRPAAWSPTDYKLPLSAPVTAAVATGTASAPAYTSLEKQTVDLVLGYSTGFKDQWVSPTMCTRLGATSCAQIRRDNTLSRLNFLVDVANQAYVNSAVATQLHLVRTIQVDYADLGDNEVALEAMTGSDGDVRSTPHPAFNALRAARDQYGGDLVVLVRKFEEPEQQGCGIAWLLGGGLSPISANDEYYGYSVVSDGYDSGTDGLSYYCLDETLAHEIGHNMGAAHDAVTANNKPGAFTYSYGYKSSWFYTIMAYGDDGQTLYRVFSNPRITYCGGQACGTAQADNARTLSQVVPLVAGFRTAIVAPPRAYLMQFDANGNGKSDLFFAAWGSTAIWYMSGATRSAYASYTTYTDDTRLVDIGDFAGDGRGDLLYVDSTNHMLYLGSTGSGFQGSTIPDSIPPDWTPVALVDVNGDGRRAEVVLRNPYTGAGAVWFYDASARRVAYSGYNVPAIEAFVGTGDLDGDRRSDVVWTDVSGHVLVTFGNGTGLAAPVQVPLAYDTRYSLVGVTDANGDGRSDLVFWRAATRQIVVWAMQGTTRASYFTSIVPGGYWLAGQGDFDGDRRGDLLWTNTSRQLMLAFSSGAGFNYSVLPYVIAPGWTTMGIQ
jgi:peptidyl-Asp metalloendopeptidase